MDTQTSVPRYYVLEQLTQLSEIIPAMAEQLAVYRTQVEERLAAGDRTQAHEAYRTLEQQRQALSARVRETTPCLLELEHPMAQAATALARQLDDFPLMTRDYSRLTGVLRQFAGALPTRQTASAAIIGRLMNHVRMGHYPTDPAHVSLLARGIAFPGNTTVNLLDPCCGTGAALHRLAAGNPCCCYGVELDESRAEAAQAVLHRVGFGSFFHCRVSPNSFHGILLNPPYLSVLSENGGHTREEKRFLLESITLLAMGGLMIYIVPCYRLTDELCRIFCDHFEQVAIYRFLDSEFRKYRQVVVLGLRRCRISDPTAALQLSQAAANPEQLPTLDLLPAGRYPLPEQPLKVSNFRGAVFNEAELAHQLRQSGSFTRLLKRRGIDSHGRQPPLPLSIGQVGLLGGSGLINGLMDCAYPHIIKGRIVKERTTRREENRTRQGALVSTTHYETISNRMIFNILTPNGFRSLT